MKRHIIFILALLIGSTAVAQADTADDIERQLQRLDTISFHPNLLPIILRNRDFLALTPEQVDAFRLWRKTNTQPMIDTMNEIVVRRIAFQEAALSPAVTADNLRALQQEIFDLHRRVLDYKLSCRDNIIRTFNANNWENLFMVLADEGLNLPIPDDYSEFASLQEKR